jgi:hypothetical protein
MAERDPYQEMQQRYRNVFGSAEGRIVLGDILSVAGFGDKLDPTNPAQVSWYNCAIEIARLAGAFDPLYQHLGMIERKET